MSKFGATWESVLGRALLKRAGQLPTSRLTTVHRMQDGALGRTTDEERVCRKRWRVGQIDRQTSTVLVV